MPPTIQFRRHVTESPVGGVLGPNMFSVVDYRQVQVYGREKVLRMNCRERAISVILLAIFYLFYVCYLWLVFIIVFIVVMV